MQFLSPSKAILLFGTVSALSGLACNAVFGMNELRTGEPAIEPDGDGGDGAAQPDAKPDRTVGVPDGSTDAPDAPLTVICKADEMRCSASGVPQKCNAQGTAFEDQDACPTDTPDCDALTGLCQARCQSGSKRCGPSAMVQQCDLQGVWRDIMSCPFACTGTGDAVTCGGTCKPGTRTCGANNTPLLCDEMGVNQMQTACATACTGSGECTGDCTPTATRCSATAANQVETCDASGHWGAATACTFVCDAATKNCSGECAPGTADRCSGSTIQSCDATGHWKDKTPCGATPCTMGQCRACTANEKQCNAGKPQTCSASGAWTDDQANACPFVCDATTGKCAGECVPGTDVCAGSSTKHCGASGVYAAATACTNICDATTGKCGGVCVPGAHHCSSTTAQTCGANGQWGSDMPCQYGCAATTGLCNTCTDEAMSTTCGGGKCGPTVNNCGHTVQCSTTCGGTGQSCGGGGVTGVCGCTPEASTVTCQNGAKCGNVLNNCGQSVGCANNCVAPQSCGGNGTPNVCGLSCTDGCTQGQKFCVTVGIATCTLGPNGCRAPGSATPCGTHQFCGGTSGAASCACNSDPVCASAGNKCASSTQQVTCSTDAQGCFYQSSSTTCNNGACSGGACCTNACTNGTNACLNASSTQIQTCSVGGNGCTSLSTASCATGQVCERAGGASCVDPQWAEWSIPNTFAEIGGGASNHLQSYKDNGDGTITDNVTGLMWQRDLDSQMSMAPAIAYCQNLRLAGYASWRLPSRMELMSIVNTASTMPALDTTVFPSTIALNMWSSTMLAGSSTTAWYVDFTVGQVDFTPVSDVNYVRCVR